MDTIFQESALCQAFHPSHDDRGRFYYPNVTDEETEALRDAIAWPDATQPAGEENSKWDLLDAKPGPFPRTVPIAHRNWAAREMMGVPVEATVCPEVTYWLGVEKGKESQPTNIPKTRRCY